jgi:hypothetical protein
VLTLFTTPVIYLASTAWRARFAKASGARSVRAQADERRMTSRRTFIRRPSPRRC